MRAALLKTATRCMQIYQDTQSVITMIQTALPTLSQSDQTIIAPLLTEFYDHQENISTLIDILKSDDDLCGDTSTEVIDNAVQFIQQLTSELQGTELHQLNSIEK